MAGIGDIGVRVSSDITDFTDGMNRTAQIAETSMRRVEQAQRIATAASDKFVASLQYQVDTFGKTDAEILRYKATLMGASSAADPLIARLEAMRKAASDTGAADGIKKSAHEMGGFSLATASAKRELLVLTHELSQGNYKKFGGSLLVLGEMTGAAGLLFSAAGLSALAFVAAVAGVAVAAAHGASAQKAMSDALILTGNYAGQTADSLNALAHAAVESGGSIGEAKKVVTQLAASGKFTGEQLGSITGAVVALEHATGASIEETIKQFESLAVQAEGHSARASTAVSQATAKLDEQYHFLTLSVYNQIAALEKEGDLKAASKVATDEFARATKERAEEIVGNLGFVARAWNGIKEAVGGATDAVASWGAKSTAASEVKRLTIALQEPNMLPGVYDSATRDAAVVQARQQLAVAQASLNRETKAAEDLSQKSIAQSNAVQAAKRIDAMILRAQTKEQNALTTALREYYAELSKLPPNDPRRSDKAVREAVAALTRLHSHPAAKIKKDDPGQIILSTTLKEQDALIAQQNNYLKERERYIAQAVASEYITTVEGLKQRRQAIADDFTATQELYAKEAADVVMRRAKLSPQTQKKQIAEEDKLLVEIEAKRAKAAEAAAAAITKANGDQLRIQSDFSRATDEWVRKENLANDALKFHADLLGRNTLEVAQLTNAKQLQLALDERIRQKVKENEDFGSTREADEARAATAVQIAKSNMAIAETYNKQRSATFGASEAVRKYGEDAANTGAQIEASLSNAFKGAEDAFVSFVMTGKLSFSSLAQSIIANLARIAAVKAIAGMIDMAIGSNGGWSPGGSSGSSSGFGYDYGEIGGGSSTASSGFGYDYGGIAGKRASGGSVSAGASYLVGENGPEVFAPTNAGTIIPNGALGGGGDIQINVNMNTTTGASSTDAKGDSKDIARLGRLIGEKVREVIVMEKRNGGMLA